MTLTGIVGALLKRSQKNKTCLHSAGQDSESGNNRFLLTELTEFSNLLHPYLNISWGSVDLATCGPYKDDGVVLIVNRTAKNNAFHVSRQIVYLEDNEIITISERQTRDNAHQILENKARAVNSAIIRRYECTPEGKQRALEHLIEQTLHSIGIPIEKASEDIKALPSKYAAMPRQYHGLTSDVFALELY